LKFAPMVIPAMALQQQHDARRDIVIEPTARRRAAIEARGHSELGRSRAIKTHLLVIVVCLSLFVFLLAILQKGLLNRFV